MTTIHPVDESAWVDAAPFRALVLHLLDATDLPLHHLACKLGVPLTVCARLLTPPSAGQTRRRTRPMTRIPRPVASQLLSRDALSLRDELERIGCARRACRAATVLLNRGHRATTLQRVTGLPLGLLADLADGRVQLCTGRVETAMETAMLWAETNQPPQDAGVSRTAVAVAHRPLKGRSRSGRALPDSAAAA